MADAQDGSTARDREEAAQAYHGNVPLPPVDFSGFILGLGQMVLIHLGEVPEPQSGQIMKDLDQARHTVDILDMLQAKTRGNLTADEEKLLVHLLSELKLRYVRLAR